MTKLFTYVEDALLRLMNSGTLLEGGNLPYIIFTESLS
jgi:hypothetical protein